MAPLFPDIANPKKRAFLAAYAHVGRLGSAAKSAQVNWRNHYNWLKADPAYAVAFRTAQDMVGDLLEEEAIRRAMGYEETHYAPDGTPYTIQKHSDTLLIFLLKGAKPAKYRERYEHSGADGGPLQIVLTRRGFGTFTSPYPFTPGS